MRIRDGSSDVCSSDLKKTERSSMSDAKTILEMIKEKNIVYVDYRFTDPRGKWQHLAMHVDAVDEDALVEGILFDGSSIAGWKAINESDMILRPDLSSAVMDPRSEVRRVGTECG